MLTLEWAVYRGRYKGGGKGGRRKFISELNMNSMLGERHYLGQFLVDNIADDVPSYSVKKYKYNAKPNR